MAKDATIVKVEIFGQVEASVSQAMSLVASVSYGKDFNDHNSSVTITSDDIQGSEEIEAELRSSYCNNQTMSSLAKKSISIPVSDEGELKAAGGSYNLVDLKIVYTYDWQGKPFGAKNAVGGFTCQ